jgi:hypothetical protein
VKKPAIPNTMIIDLQRRLIIERKDAVAENPELITTDRWDLSKIFYDTRTLLDQWGYDTSPMNNTVKRKAIHNDIKKICEQLGVKRHEIGIFAADRAQMAFNGEIYNVTFETFRWLARLGTDIIFTEKEGFVNTVLPFTTHKGIALVQSGGWSSEYTIFLIETAYKLGFRNIAILTDFDSQGVGIAMKFPYVIRLGVDLQTVSDLGVNLSNVEEHINPLKWNKRTRKMEENSHWLGLNTELKKLEGILEILSNKDEDELIQFVRFYVPFLRNNLTYLRSNRVELGAITARVGAERFWNWLENKILEKFPTRDYNRAIEVPEIVHPDAFDKMTEKIDDKIRSVLKDSHDYWKVVLNPFEGFIDNTDDKLKEIESDMRKDLMENDDIKNLIKDLDAITKKKYLN